MLWVVLCCISSSRRCPSAGQTLSKCRAPRRLCASRSCRLLSAHTSCCCALLLAANQVSGDVRAMRRQMRERALGGLDRLEAVKRAVLSAASPAAYNSAAGGPVGRSQELPAFGEAGRAGSLAGGAAAEEDYVYQPTKVSGASGATARERHACVCVCVCRVSEHPSACTCVLQLAAGRWVVVQFKHARTAHTTARHVRMRTQQLAHGTHLRPRQHARACLMRFPGAATASSTRVHADRDAADASTSLLSHAWRVCTTLILT